MSARKRIVSILFWSVISAAFIGPGTITSAAKSGAVYGSRLLWALLFSTLACLLLQEAASRISILTGRNLGQSIAHQYRNSRFRWLIFFIIIGAIGLGSAAYEMGNLLGAAAGIQLLFNAPSWWIVLLLGGMGAVLLSIPSLKIISTILGSMVMLMGLGFAVTAFMVFPEFGELLKGVFIPQLPDEHALVLVMALIGTTIVPYNLFLGSGLADHKQTLGEMRFGLAVAILLGGLFSMAVLVTGSAISGNFSFEALAGVLQQRMGHAGRYLLGFGLFAAGFTSTVTAPLATAITLRSLFAAHRPEKWGYASWRFRMGWVIVLLTGVLFASFKLKPVPAIIAAQAFNGLLLPMVSIFLYSVLRKSSKTSRTHQGVMLVVIFITLLIGLNALYRLIAPLFGQ